MNGRSQYCLCPLATLIILISTAALTLIIFITGQANDYICDTNSILFYGQWYRLFTSIYAAYSIRDLFYLIICTLWLGFLLPNFEKRTSTLYTLFHFFKVNFIVQGGLILFTFYLFNITFMRNNSDFTYGLYPYTMLLFLRDSLINQKQICFFFCSPVPINKKARGYIGGLAFIYFSPSLHPAVIIYVYWILTNCVCCQKCVCREGSLFPQALRVLESIMGCTSRMFISIDGLGEKEEEGKKRNFEDEIIEQIEGKGQIEDMGQKNEQD